MSDGLHIPAYSDLLWPTLRAVREIGNSGTNEEIVERVIANEGFTEEQLAVPANNGRSGLIEYRLAWARSYLKGMSLLENSQRGVWSTTELGRTIAPDEIPAVYAAYLAQLRETQRLKKAARAQDDPDDLHDPLGTVDAEGSSEWKERLLLILQKGISPDQFERLARRLLLEAGFVSATVTGKSWGRRDRRHRGLSRIATQLSRVLSMQALRGKRRLRCGARLPWGDERAWREGPADHDRHLHLRSQARVHP